MARSRSRSVATAFAACLVLTACGSSGESPDESGGGSQPAGAPTTLIVGWGETAIDTLDPAIGYDFTSWPAEALIFESLVGYAGNTTDLEPRLAEAMPEVSEDGLVYTFTLRDGISFVLPEGTAHREITADDVVFSLNRVLRPDLTPSPSPVGHAFFGIIDGADAVLAGEAEEATGLVARDDRTVEITLTQPDGTFVYKLATPFGSVVPADIATTDTEAFSTEPVGTGQYLLASHSIGEEATFVRNPHYWGTPGEAAEIEFRMNLDGNTLVEEVETNRVDVMATAIPAALWPTIRDDPTYQGRVFEIPQLTINYLAMDTSGPDSPFADVGVRQAASHAVDRENIVRLLAGQAAVYACLYPGPMGESMECDGYAYDVDQARSLLAETEFSDGFATELYTDTTDDSQAIAQAIQQDLGEIGIDVEIVAQPFDTLLETISVPHAAPLVYIGWFADYPDPSNFYDPILSCATAVENGANVSWFCDEELDGLAAQANAQQEPTRRAQLYEELQRRVMEQAPWVSLISPVTTTLVSDRVQDFAFHPVWGFDFATVAVGD